MSDTIHAPWTPAQVEALNTYQRSGYFHPYTCGKRDQWEHGEGELIATENGWVCPDCSYTQDWAHAASVNPDLLDAHRRMLEGHFRQ